MSEAEAVAEVRAMSDGEVAEFLDDAVAIARGCDNGVVALVLEEAAERLRRTQRSVPAPSMS